MMFSYLATRQDKINHFIEELARAGYPECNARPTQRKAARSIGYDDLDDWLDTLTDDELEYITEELERKLTI